MVKKDFVGKIASDTGLNKALVKMVIEKLLNEIRDSLSNQERIEIRNFGVFYARKMKAKKGRNLRTGEIIAIPERMKIVFKPSKVFKDISSVIHPVRPKSNQKT